MGLLRATLRAVLGLPRPLRAAACLLWMAGIFGLSSGTFEAPAGPAGLWRVAANLVHAPLFGVLCLGFCAWFLELPAPGENPRVARGTLVLILAATLLYALLDEVHQAFVPGRHPSAFDLLTDAAGAASALWIVAYVAGERASDRGLRRRLAAGALSCLAAASLSSLVGAG